MIELKLNAIRMSLVTQHRVVVLQELGGEERFLPIWIGAYYGMTTDASYLTPRKGA